MTEFLYNNAKNASTDHISFQLNCRYYPIIFIKDKDKLYLRSCSTNKLAKELKKLIKICY